MSDYSAYPSTNFQLLESWQCTVVIALNLDQSLHNLSTIKGRNILRGFFWIPVLHSCQPQLTQIRNQAFENAEIAIILRNPLKSYGFIQTMLKVPIRCRDRCIGLHNIDKHF